MLLYISLPYSGIFKKKNTHTQKKTKSKQNNNKKKTTAGWLHSAVTLKVIQTQSKLTRSLQLLSL